MNKLLAWLRSKNVTSHSIALGVVSLAGLIMGDEQVRSWITGAFVDHPRISTAIIGAASIILKYSHSSSPAGAVAQAKEVINSPDAPTASQVDAATTQAVKEHR